MLYDDAATIMYQKRKCTFCNNNSATKHFRGGGSRSKVAPQLSFNEIAGFQSSSRSYLRKYGVPRHTGHPGHPDVVIVR